MVGERRSAEAIYSRANIDKLKTLIDYRPIDVFDFIRDLTWPPVRSGELSFPT